MPVKKPAAKPAPAKKAAPAKKPAAKPAPAKKAEPAKKPAAKPAPKAAPKKEEKKAVDFRNYHVAKRADGKWQVKYAGGEKAIKLFATQKEALEYTNKMAANQGGAVLVHASKGAQKGKIKKKQLFKTNLKWLLSFDNTI